MNTGFPSPRSRRNSADRPCGGCNACTAGDHENVATDPFKCSIAGLTSLSAIIIPRRMAAFQGVNIDAEDPGWCRKRLVRYQMSGGAKLQVRVAEVVEVNELIKRFGCVSRDGSALPAFSGGAHTVVEMDDHGTREAESLFALSDPEDRSGYEISVRRDDVGRGGFALHARHVVAGDEMTLSYPSICSRWTTGEEAPDDRGRDRDYSVPGADRADGAFWRAVRAALFGPVKAAWRLYGPADGGASDRVHCYFDDQKQMIDLKKVLEKSADWHASLRCGPKGMIGWVLATARGWAGRSRPCTTTEFLAPGTGLPFQVGAWRQWQDHHRRHHAEPAGGDGGRGVDAPYLCRGGACGQCRNKRSQMRRHDPATATTGCRRKEQASNQKIMPCVSRASRARPSSSTDRRRR